MTECTQETFGFTAHFSRRVEAGFTAGQVSSDGGAPLLREVDRKINLLARLAGCFLDGRDPERIQHTVEEMLSQRIFGLALGYEDLNDHEQLRSDPLLALLSGKRDLDEPLAGKSTLNRLELVGRSERYHKIGYSAEAIDCLLGDLYIESHATSPAEIVLDLDATDIPLYGHQPERFFHGYYDNYCYLPLYIFAGDQLLCARLRPANQDAAAGSVEEVSRIVAQFRARWPGARPTVSTMSSDWRATSGSAKSSGPRCIRPASCTRPPAKPRASSPSSTIKHARAGHGRAAWWPRPSISTKAKIRAS
jgi:hypothetical protein